MACTRGVWPLQEDRVRARMKNFLILPGHSRGVPTCAKTTSSCSTARLKKFLILPGHSRGVPTCAKTASSCSTARLKIFLLFLAPTSTLSWRVYVREDLVELQYRQVED